MANLYPVAGMKFYIGNARDTQLADFVAADFTGETWIEVDGWDTCGAIGDNSEVVEFDLINRNRKLKQKGTADAGNMENVFAQIVDDPGQIAIIAASLPSNKSNYAFRIALNDLDGGATPSYRYFVGLVMTAVEEGGGANDPRNLSVTIGINSNIVRVAAT